MVNIRRGYGVGSPRIGIFPRPIRAQRAPTTQDINYPIGQLWVDNRTGGGVFILQRISGTASWINMGGAGGNFDSLTVTPGPTTLTGVFTTSGGAASINASSNFNTVINSGTSTGTVTIGNGAAGAVNIDSGAGISLDAVTASNFSTSGAGADLTLASSLGRVIIDGGESVANAVTIDASDPAGGVSITSGTGSIALGAVGATADVNIDAERQAFIEGQASAANAVRITASDAAGGIDIDAGTGGITMDVTGAADISIASSAGSVIASGAEAVIDAVQLTASAGAVQVTGGALAATTGLNMVQGAANALIQVGAGAPAHSAPQGSLYMRTDGTTTNDRAYINTDGATTWTAITTVA